MSIIHDVPRTSFVHLNLWDTKQQSRKEKPSTILLEEHLVLKKKQTNKKKVRKKENQKNCIPYRLYSKKRTCFIADFIRNLNNMSMKISSGTDCVSSIRSSFECIMKFGLCPIFRKHHFINLHSILCPIFRKLHFINLHSILCCVSITQKLKA